MTSRQLPVTTAGFTHASSDIPLDSCNDVEFGMSMRELVPLKFSPFPYFPAEVQVAFTSLPVWPFPDASAVVVPDPSSKPYAATSVGPPPPPELVVAPAEFEYGPRLAAASFARTRYV